MSIGDFLEILSQAVLVGIILVGRSGEVHGRAKELRRDRIVGARWRRLRRRGAAGAQTYVSYIYIYI